MASKKQRVGLAFLSLGVTFLAIGLAGRKAFVSIAAAFFAIAFFILMSARKGQGPPR